MKKLVAVIVAVLAVSLPVAVASTSSPQRYSVGTAADNATQRGTTDQEYGLDLDVGGNGFVMSAPTIDGVQSVGARFENVQLAPGEHVASAYLMLFNNFGYRLDATVAVEASGSDFAVNPTIIRRTVVGSVAWEVPRQIALHRYFTSPDLAPLVNAALATPGWEQGDALTFTVAGDVDVAYPYPIGLAVGDFASGHPARLVISP